MEHRSEQRSAAVILALALAFFFGRFVGIDAEDPYLGRYDEGVYYYSAQRIAEGEQPYRDFQLLQPPGLMLLSAAGIRAGLLLPGQRIVHALSGALLGGIVYLIAGRAPGSKPYTPALAALLLFSSPLFFANSRIVTTELPATILLAASILLVMVAPRGSIVLAAMTAAASSLFRLQGACLRADYFARHRSDRAR
jgi:4-amino-4-deoxy-L-arabinose transferase-like glycosyltransferase